MKSSPIQIQEVDTRTLQEHTVQLRLLLENFERDYEGRQIMFAGASWPEVRESWVAALRDITMELERRQGGR